MILRSSRATNRVGSADPASIRLNHRLKLHAVSLAPPSLGQAVIPGLNWCGRCHVARRYLAIELVVIPQAWGLGRQGSSNHSKGWFREMQEFIAREFA